MLFKPYVILSQTNYTAFFTSGFSRVFNMLMFTGNLSEEKNLYSISQTYLIIFCLKYIPGLHLRAHNEGHADLEQLLDPFSFHFLTY